MARDLTWSNYIELQGITVQGIINSFDALRARKKQLIKSINGKIGSGGEPFDEVAELKEILDKELELITSAINQMNLFLDHPRYFKKALQRSRFNKLTDRIWAALGKIFSKLRKIKLNVIKERRDLLKCMGDKDFFHYRGAFELPTGKEKCPYEIEQEIYAEIDEILEREKGPITEILTVINLGAILRKGALSIVIAVIVAIVAISTMVGNGADESKLSKATSKLLVKKQTPPSTQKATVQLSRGSITPKGGFPTILAKRGHTLSKYFEDYKEGGGRLNLQKYVGKFMKLNGTDKLKIGNIYRLPNL
jgi:hypothetical protein